MQSNIIPPNSKSLRRTSTHDAPGFFCCCCFSLFFFLLYSILSFILLYFWGGRSFHSVSQESIIYACICCDTPLKHVLPCCQCIKILMSVRNGSGKFGGRDYGREHAAAELKLMQSESRSWSGRNCGAVRSDHARLLLTRDPTRAQGCWCVRLGDRVGQTRADVVKEVRPRKHNYVGSEERTVVRRAVLARTEVSDFCVVKSCWFRTAHLGERRAVWNRGLD